MDYLYLSQGAHKLCHRKQDEGRELDSKLDLERQGHPDLWIIS